MIKAVVKFLGNEQDAHGMPNPYFSYFVMSSPCENPKHGIASIVPLTSPLVTTEYVTLSPHYQHLTDGEEGAYALALIALKGHPHHAKLRFHEHRE